MKKRFGQHFLTDRSILRRIIQFADIRRDDTVLEIGPGTGALTAALAAAAHRVIAIEIDRDLIADLRQTVPANVEIIHGDALHIEFPSGRYRVVANLPYNVATALLRRMLDMRERIIDITVMVQKEVAGRMIAKPASDDYGPLSVLIQYYTAPKYGFNVPPGAFRPRPQVDSAVIHLDWKPDVPGAHGFTDFVHDAFSSRRKKLVNNLVHMYPELGRERILNCLMEAGAGMNCRPEDLSLEQFLRVYNQVSKAGGE